MRYVFEVLRRGSVVSINDLDRGYYGAHRRMLFDELVPVNAGDLLAPEIDDFLPDVFRGLAASGGGPHIVKVHDKAFHTGSGEWLYPPETVRTVIYLTRHPFDVAASYAHHVGVPVREAVAHMGRDELVAAVGRRSRMPLHEHLGSWSGNVTSWLDSAPYNLMHVRYEDLFTDPVTVFARVARSAGLSAGPDAIARACEAARFERLQDEERTGGFFERPRTSPAFFRSGKPHSWGGVLDEASLAQLTVDHGPVMERLGYRFDGRTEPGAIA